MATIGTFTKTENGYTGAVKTLTLNVKTVKFVPAEGDSERGPDFRIFAGATEFGAAWKKTARETQREYLSVSPARHWPDNPVGVPAGRDDAVDLDFVLPGLAPDAEFALKSPLEKQAV